MQNTNSIFKKITSIFLSLVFILSTFAAVPFVDNSVITAKAASITSTHLVGAYLVDNITDGIAVNNGVEWKDGWAVFNSSQGDYLKIDGHPMESVSHTKEFTVAFDLYKTDANSESRVFEFTDGTIDESITADKHFSFVGGSSGWYQYNVLFRNKDFKDYGGSEGQQRVYYGNDWTNGNYTESNAGSTAPGLMGNNNSYSIVINMSTDGKLRVYVDGELKVTFKSNYATWGIAGGIAGYLFDGACYSLFKDLTDYYIGSAQPGHYFDGKLRNFYLFDKALSASEVNAEVDVSTSNLSDLTNQMYAYEGKFENSNDVYINMTPAYDAYRRAWRIFDTRNETNGYNQHDTTITPKDIGLAAAILYHTTQNMTTWSAYSGTAVPSVDGNWGINTPSSFTHSATGATIRPYNNMLYTVAWHIWGGGNHTDNHVLLMDNRGCVYVYYPNTALLYDGVENNTYFPLTAWLQADGTGNGHDSVRHVFEIYPTTSSATTGNRPADTRFTFYDNWHSVSDNTTFDRIASIHSPQNYVGVTYNSGQCSWDFNNTEYFLANVMFFNDASNLAQAENGYNAYALNWTVNAAGNSTWYDSDSNLNKTATHDCNIYVIDYSKVKTAISNYGTSKIGNLNRASIANYKEGGYENVFAAFDKATYDPNIAFCNGLPHDKNDIRNASKLAGLSSVNGASAVASATANVDNPSGFSALRNYLNLNANPTNYSGEGTLNTNTVYNGFNDDKVFTTSSYNEFVIKYTEAQNELGLVYETDGPYSRKTQAETAASALIKAYNNLEQTADFKSVDAAYTTAISDYNNLDRTLYTTTSLSNLNTYLTTATNFPYHERNSEQRDDTGVSSQSEINAEANNLSTALSRILERKADFSDLDDAKNAALTEVDSASVASAYTTSSVAAAKAYLMNPEKFPFEYSANRDDTGVSQNSAIAAEVLKFNNWKTAGYLKLPADFSELDTAYANADSKLKELAQSDVPIYSNATISDLISAVGAGYENATLDTSARHDTAAVDAQDTIDNQTTNINNSISSLSGPDGIDLSVYNNVISTIKNHDNDAYQYNDADPNAIVSVLTANVADDVEYTVDQTVYSINTFADGLNQKAIDEVIATGLESLNTHFRKYEITANDGVDVSFALDGTDGYDNETGKYYARYNNTAVFRTNNEDTAWYMSFVSGSGISRGRQYQAYGDEFTTNVIGNLNVEAVQRNESTTPNKVTILRQYLDSNGNRKNMPMAIQCIDFVDKSYTLPVAPAYAFYDFQGYIVNGETKNAENTVTGIDKDITITAIYKESSANAEYTVSVTGINSTTIFNGSAEYNKKIDVSDDNAYAWVERLSNGKERLFYIGSSFTYFVTESSSIYAITQDQFNKAGYSLVKPSVNLRTEKPIANKLDNGKTKLIFNGQVVPENANVYEYGVLIGKATNGSITNDDLIVENAGVQTGYTVIRAKATKPVGANQFTIGFTSNMTGHYIYRGYVTYFDSEDGMAKTIYTSVEEDAVV